MSSSGPNSPGTLADDSSFGAAGASWTTPSDAAASDNVRTVAVIGATQDTHYLKATNFGFSVSGTIDGVLVEIEKQAGVAGGNQVQDAVVKLVVGGSVVGTNKADTVTNWSGTDSYISYGGPSDLWGLTPADSDINASNFGVVLSAHAVLVSGKSGCQPRVDHIRITVYYTAGGGGSSVKTLAAMGVG